MNHIPTTRPAPGIAAAAAAAFCIWTALGNHINICFAAGCQLFEDFSIAGISFWWLGASAFIALALAAFLGLRFIGILLATLCLAADSALLLLMAFSAPCSNCLIVAAFFAIVYLLFRLPGPAAPSSSLHEPGPRRRPSFLIWIWAILFVINTGTVARSQLDVWPILGDSEAATHMFFSPSCKYCVEAINVISGNVDTAFYPVAENEEDVFRLARMQADLDRGMNLAEALGASTDAKSPGFLAGYSPEMLLLRFRLLRNKAHIFMAGARGVPYFERTGLPPNIRQTIEGRKRPEAQPAQPASRDATLPLDTGDGICAPGKPCP